MQNNKHIPNASQGAPQYRRPCESVIPDCRHSPMGHLNVIPHKATQYLKPLECGIIKNKNKNS